MFYLLQKIFFLTFYRTFIVLFTLSVSISLNADEAKFRKEADSLLQKKDYISAFKLSESIIKEFPENHFGWWLRMHSTSQLSSKKGKWPNLCAESAKQLAILDSANEASTLTNAIWCLRHIEDYKGMISFIPNVIPNSRIKIGDNNYALLINLLSTTYLKLGEKEKARSLLKSGIEELKNTSFISETGYNTAELFQDESISKDERMVWNHLFTETWNPEKKNNPLLPAMIWNTMFLTDMYVLEKKYGQAFDTISLLYPNFDQEVKNHWGFIRDQLYIRYLALKFKLKRTKEEPKKILKFVFLKIEKTRLKTPLPKTLQKFGNLDTDLREKDFQDLILSFEYFQNSFESLSGGIRPEMEVITHEGVIQSTNLRDEKFRFVMQPDIQSIHPKLNEDTLTKIKAADGVILVWPGTRQPAGVLITNGGGTEWNYGTDSDPEIRLTILSDSNKNKNGGNHANHPIFIYHEMFHVLEWAYYKLPFPQENHPYMRRNEWPKDYEGSTEWDFYSETFSKRMMPADNFERVYWLGRMEGFYGIKVKESK